MKSQQQFQFKVKKRMTLYKSLKKKCRVKKKKKNKRKNRILVERMMKSCNRVMMSLKRSY
jgi:hypothetical protein